jgi:hypothetical protein
MVGNRRVERRVSCSQSRRVTVSLVPVSGPPGSRTPRLLFAGQVLYQDELAAQSRRRIAAAACGRLGSLPSMLTLWTCQVLPGTFTPEGGARRDAASRTLIQLALEASSLTAGSSLCKRKTALRGYPLGRSPSAPPRGYMATTPVLGWLSSRDMAARDSVHGFSYPCRVALICQNVMPLWYGPLPVHDNGLLPSSPLMILR